MDFGNLEGANLIWTLLVIAWGTIPVIFVFITRRWNERFKALIGWSVISAVFMSIIGGAIGFSIVEMISAIVGLAIYYLIAGTIVMVLADFIGEPIARFIERKT